MQRRQEKWLFKILKMCLVTAIIYNYLTVSVFLQFLKLLLTD